MAVVEVDDARKGTQLVMANADAVRRNSRGGRPAGKKGQRGAKLTAVSDQPAVDATRRTEILKTANSVVGPRLVFVHRCSRSPTLRASSPAASITISIPRKPSSSS